MKTNSKSAKFKVIHAGRISDEAMHQMKGGQVIFECPREHISEVCAFHFTACSWGYLNCSPDGEHSQCPERHSSSVPIRDIGVLP